MCLSFSSISIGSQWKVPHSLQINKCTHTATGTYSNFILYQTMLQQALYRWLFLKMWLCHVIQHDIILGLVAAILNWGHTHHNRLYINPIQVYNGYKFYTVTPQPGPKNTLTNCICTSCFYITACLNNVTNFSSMPAKRLKQEVANKSGTSYYWHHTC
jgi:hypothetical protein